MRKKLSVIATISVFTFSSFGMNLELSSDNKTATAAVQRKEDSNDAYMVTIMAQPAHLYSNIRKFLRFRELGELQNCIITIENSDGTSVIQFPKLSISTKLSQISISQSILQRINSGEFDSLDLRNDSSDEDSSSVNILEGWSSQFEID